MPTRADGPISGVLSWSLAPLLVPFSSHSLALQGTDISVVFLFLTFLHTSLPPCRVQTSGLCQAMASRERLLQPTFSAILAQMRSCGLVQAPASTRANKATG